ncbi:MAG: hypothetical protein FVQ84_08290 [Planctomycetes bacterium]|nr:hypothetical protein [Planctomycetota bacterium]
MKVEFYKIEDGITQSMIQSFYRCRILAQNNLDTWESTLDSRRALDYGNMWHLLLQRYTEKVLIPKNVKADLTRVFKQFWTEWWNREVNKPGVDQNNLMEDLNMAEILWPYYLEKYMVKDFKLDWIEAEPIFDVNFNGYRLRGRIDGVFRFPKIRRRLPQMWHFETKTAGQISEETLNSTLGFDFQNRCYNAVGELRMKERIFGAIQNIIRRPGQQGETKEKLDKIAKDVKDRPDHYFLRVPVTYPKQNIKYFIENELMVKLREWSKFVGGEIPIVPAPVDTCRGRYNCNFLKVCNGKTLTEQNGAPGYRQGGIRFKELID